MRVYGLKKEEIEVVRSLLQKCFGNIDDCKVYLFGSRATGKQKPFSDLDIFIKSKSPEISNKIPLFLEAWEKSSIPYKVDVTEWKDLFKPYVPQINKEKQLLWSSVQKNLPMRVCPYGEHWVNRHNRVKNGNVEDVDGHCRKDPGRKDVLYKDEIQFISNSKEFLSIKNKICPYRGKEKISHAEDYDQLIIGWCNYWNQIFQSSQPIDPSFFKALIYSESRFQPSVIKKNSKKIGNAIGIAQITESTLKILRDRNGEIKDHYLILKKDDLLDPNINICAGVRWLFQKRYLLAKRLGREPSWIEVIAEYKGLGAQLKKNGEEALNVMKKFHESLEYFKC